MHDEKKTDCKYYFIQLCHAYEFKFIGMTLNACLALNMTVYSPRVGGSIAKVLYCISYR